MTTESVHDRVQSQFGAAAAAYTTSIGHGDPRMIAPVIKLAEPKPSDRALDIATGAGHTAIALAPHVTEVIAYDITPPMLEETARNAKARGISNLITALGPAEKLPFNDASFDIVTVRQAPHHFADIQSAIAEMARVARRGARIVVVDSTSPEDATLAREFNYIEKLRDPSHVCNYQPSRWREMIAAAGLRITHLETGFYMENGGAMDFATWTVRMKTPPAAVEELKRLFRGASRELVDALRIEVAGDKIGFCVPQVTIAARKD